MKTNSFRKTFYLVGGRLIQIYNIRANSDHLNNTHVLYEASCMSCNVCEVFMYTQ